MKSKLFLLLLMVISLTACGAGQSQSPSQNMLFYWLIAMFFCTFVAFGVGRLAGQAGTDRRILLIAWILFSVMTILAWVSPATLLNIRHRSLASSNTPSEDANNLLLARYGMPSLIFFYSLGYFKGRNYIHERKETARLRCPPEIESYMRKAEELIAAEEYEAAMEQLREAIRISPTSAVAHNNLGAVLAIAQRFEEAEKEYLEALELSVADPYAPHPYVQARSNLGRLRGYTGKYKDHFHDDLQAVIKAYRKDR